MKIIIVGGGIGGLSLAVALKNKGIQSVVYEKASVMKEIGSGIVLSPNGIKALDAVDKEIGKKVRQQGEIYDPNLNYPFLLSNGKVLSQSDFGTLANKYGAPMITIERYKLHSILKEALETQSLFTGHNLVDFKQDVEKVKVEFGNGHIDNGDLMVGADGIHSQVRKILIGDKKPNYLGITAVRGIVENIDHPYIHSGFLTMGKGAQIFTSPLSQNRLYWTATWNSTEGHWISKDTKEIKKFLLEKYKNWHNPIPTMIENTELNKLVVTDIYDRNPLKTWTQGRVTLLGDAAHPMSPFMGQGSNMAIEDAIVLANQIHLHGENEYPSALIGYERERISRTSKMVLQSRQFVTMGKVENPILVKLRDGMMSTMMKFSNSDKQNEWLFKYKPQ